ncbi:unnamed protein product [Spodoptera exigua]|nr:unnamed protein product [Spodoptera exigua]
MIVLSSPLQFTCSNGACVPLVWVCDADSDCGDGSDEGAQCAARTCGPADFRCGSGRCIPREWLCDAEPDCPGREDEAACGAARAPPPCDPTYFRCPDGRCVPGRWRCDGDDDCGDGADELGCEPRPCSESEFRCGSGECVRASLRCSGAADCADASDEAGCAPHCGPGARACRGGAACVRSDWWCDGTADCADGSDEAQCGAGAGRCGARLDCGGAAPCAPAAWRCDGRRDCADGRDEAAAQCAALACPPPMFRCEDATCLPPNLLCDGVPDCAGDEDAALCARRRWLGEESPCAAGETLCGDGRCVPGNSSCVIVQLCARPMSSRGVTLEVVVAERSRACRWDTCSQLCLPKHDNHTCKCVPGYKQRQLADGTLTCEALGDKPLVLVAAGGALHLWEPHKQAPAAAPPASRSPDAPPLVDITCAAAALVGAQWWLVWGDAGGALQAADATALLAAAGAARAAQLAALAAREVARAEGAVRGVALDAAARRVYWSSAGADGALHVAALDGRRRATLYRRAGAEPDAVVLHGATLYWAERGRWAGVRAAGADGAGLRWLVARRVRRPAALALDAAAARLYFVDEYYDTLETVRLDGSDRVTLARFSQRPDPAPRAPTYYVDGDEQRNYKEVNGVDISKGAGCDEMRLAPDGGAVGGAGPRVVVGRACVRALVWEEWVWCVTPRALLRLHKRGAGAPRAARAPTAAPLTALVLLHAAAGGAGGAGPDPCAAACHSTALCVRSAAPRGSACLCPDGLLPDDNADLCVCHPGYEGARCELAVGAGGAGGAGGTGGAGEEPCGAVTCENQGTCVVAGGRAACACAAEYTGARCERCVGGPDCGPAGVCVRAAAGPHCRADICRFFCLNQVSGGPLPAPRRGPQPATVCVCVQGTCSVSAVGAVSCACPPAWSGERCQRPACVDAACSAHDAGNDTDDVPTAHDHTERADHADHDEHDHNASKYLATITLTHDVVLRPH